MFVVIAQRRGGGVETIQRLFAVSFPRRRSRAAFRCIGPGRRHPFSLARHRRFVHPPNPIVPRWAAVYCRRRRRAIDTTAGGVVAAALWDGPSCARATPRWAAPYPLTPLSRSAFDVGLGVGWGKRGYKLCGVNDAPLPPRSIFAHETKFRRSSSSCSSTSCYTTLSISSYSSTSSSFFSSSPHWRRRAWL